MTTDHAKRVAETLAVAIQMGGGPSANYAADALRAFVDKTTQIAPTRKLSRGIGDDFPPIFRGSETIGRLVV